MTAEKSLRNVTTEVVRDAVAFPRTRLGEPRTIKTEDFDRWLDAIKREVAAEALEQTARDVKESLRLEPHDLLSGQFDATWNHALDAAADRVLARAAEIREGK